MDRIRQDAHKRKRRKILLYSSLGVLAVGALIALTLLTRSPVPTVDRQAVWVDTVKQGPLEVAVRGMGTLQPEEVRWNIAQTDARVERIAQWPGANVTDDTVIIELSSPELEQQLRNAQLQLSAAEADYANLEADLESRLLELKSSLAQIKSAQESATLEVQVNRELFDEGLVAELTLRKSELDAARLEQQLDLEQQRLKFQGNALKKQLAARLAQVEQERERYNLLKSQVDQLIVRAGTDGVLQRLPVEVGQQVTAGQNLAQIADPTRLKAVIRVPETQARDIVIGQRARVDTRNGIVTGRVVRINPTVEGGTVDVDVALESDLPRGARADLTVEGVVELARLDDVVFVGRPALGRENGTARLFRLEDEGKSAVRVPVQFGRSSVSAIEIQNGLNPGDRVILSDTSDWNDFDRIKLN